MNSTENQDAGSRRAAATPLWRVGIAAVFFGLALSAAYFYWKEETAPPPASAPAQEPAEAEMALPGEGLTTDAFSIRLLQAALRERNGNVTVAPSAVTELILTLQAVDGVPMEETCKRFGLQICEPSAATLPSHYIQVFADEAQQAVQENRSLMPLPIERDAVRASAFINRMSQPQDRAADLMVSASDIHPDDQFITVVDQSFAAPWLHPISRRHTVMLPFATAVGLPDTPMMQTAANYRVAQAPDDSWEAAALLFKRATGSQDDWVGLVVVRPKLGTARRMAEKLTVDQVSAIRRALAAAPARPYNLQLPPLRVDAGPVNILPMLQHMELNPQPRSREGDNAGQQARGSVFLRFHVAAAESAEPDAKDAVETVQGYPLLCLNSSYLWWIGSMTSPAPFLYMGVVEQP